MFINRIRRLTHEMFKAKSVILSGIKIPIDDRIFSPVIINSLESKEYEHQESSELPWIIEDGERILEIGGGIGYISALAARDKRTSSIRVYEANPFLIPLIKNIHRINCIEGVEVLNGVLSNNKNETKSKFYLRQDFWASSLKEKPWDYNEVIEVPNMSFSQEIKTFNPTLIICDIEGGELDLFQNSTLEGVNKVYMEVHQDVLGRRGMKSLFDVMSDKGFHYDQWHSCRSVVLFSFVYR